jgi:IS605 OrfB family transposase
MAIRIYQTRLRISTAEDASLSDYAALFSKVERKLYAELQANKKSINELKREYIRKYDITARQFNSIRIEVQGKISAVKECRNFQIEKMKNKITSVKEVITKISNTFKTHNKKRYLYRLQLRLQRLEADKKIGITRICFGSKNLFHKQFNLESNKLNSHKEWKNEWQDRRNSQFYLVGSKDETGGNNSCVLLKEYDNTFSIRLRLPNCLAAGNGKYLILKDIRFTNGQNFINETVRRNSSKTNRVSVTYRFLKKENKWYVYLSTTLEQPKAISIWGSGVVGVDLNIDKLAITETDRFGNKLNSFNIPCDTRYKSASQRKAIIGDAVKELINFAVSIKKEIVIEDLDFSKKKAQSDLYSKRYNRMLSSFAYSYIKDNLQARAFDAGITVRKVNPAYTSIIGFYKFSKRYGLSRHQAAALCIARRYQGFRETLPKQLQVTLSKSARKRNKHVWSRWAEILKKSRAALAALRKSEEPKKSYRSVLTPKEGTTNSRLNMGSTLSYEGEIPSGQPLPNLFGDCVVLDVS